MDRLTRIILLAVVVSGLAIARPSAAESPRIDLVGPIGLYHADELIPVDVRVTSSGAVINAAELFLTYPADVLRVDSVKREQTVFELWPESPSWDDTAGTIHLIGGRANGLVAINATIATIYFRTNRPGVTTVGLDGSRSGLYLNDGQGTKVAVASTSVRLQPRDPLVAGILVSSSTHPNADQWYSAADVTITWDVKAETKYSYTFSQDSQSIPDHVPETTVGAMTYMKVQDGRHYFTIRESFKGGEWSEATQLRIFVDTTPPQPFTLLRPDPADVGDRQLLTWTSIDTTSGVARTTLAVNGHDQGAVSSPLELRSSWQGKVLTITTYDQAGNERSASWKFPGRSTAIWLSVTGGVVGVVVLIGIIVWLRRSKRIAS